MGVIKKLTDRERRFVEAYLGAAAGNGAKAVVLAGYSKAGAKVTAHHLLKKSKIQTLLVSLRDEKINQALTADAIVKQRLMSGEEALERMTVFARADIGRVLGPTDPIAQLPEDVRVCIKSVTPTKYGRRIDLYDAMHATEVLAKAGGKLKDIVQVESLEVLIAKSWAAA